MPAAACPDCRSHALRRRKRSGFLLYVVSLLGQWPYQCDECGSNFMLRNRYLRVRKKKEELVVHEPEPNSHREMLTAPIGGVAGGNEAHLREDDADGESDNV
jgi:hypothetical protein